jgi:glycosyltransferase involved in cell wall biosynthesis
MRVSIVIPTYNRSGLLRRTVPALANQQTFEALTYEVIFVNNGSSDDTKTVLKEAVAQYPGKFRFQTIAPTGGPSAPRNTGIRMATGDVVVILDDDVLPDSDMLIRHAQFHREHPEGHHCALGELYVPQDLRSDPMSVFHQFPYDALRELDRLTYLHFWTCNVSVKRSFMLDAGMFDEKFLAYEDILCGHKLAARGMHLHFLAAARGQHLHQQKASGLPAKGTWYGLWLYPFLQRLADPAANRRFGVLTPDIGAALYVKRCLRRAVFRAFDNPAMRAILRLLGATSGTRSKISDLYYYMIFRRNLVAGYAQAKRQARKERGMAVSTGSQWENRGES